MSEPPCDEPLRRYAIARDGVADALVELQTLLGDDATWHGAAADREHLERTLERLRDGRFVLAVVGEFSSGKSFLLNALLRKVVHEERLGVTRIVGLLATDINPSTATITELVYAQDELATAHYADGRQERIPLDRLARFVAVGADAKLHDATTDETGSPTLVRVAVNSTFLANGFVVADTPGLASINPVHRRATLAYLPGADAVLYLIDTQQPFSAGDASFLGIVQRYIESIFIVQTKIDLWRMHDGERETWQTASTRIVAQAALHAPGVPVLPVSARDYAEGLITGDAELVAQSRFPDLLAALDASLVATTGRSRLRRAAADARSLATRVGDALAGEARAHEHDEPTLLRLRDDLAPALTIIDTAAFAAGGTLLALGATLEETIIASGAQLRADLHHRFIRAFDTADIARLRDRAKLHSIIDDTLASAVGQFAADIAELIVQRLRAAAKTAAGDVLAAGRDAGGPTELATLLTTISGERIPLTEDVATAFGADPASGAWSTDLETGLRSTIVLGALGGPAIGLVAAIAGRFAAAPYGTYMKRELLADFGAGVAADFDAELAAYVARTAAQVRSIAHRLGERIAALTDRIRGESLGAIERALSARRAGLDPPAYARRARETAKAPTARVSNTASAPARRSRSTRPATAPSFPR
jgi:hypothetical protein